MADIAHITRGNPARRARGVALAMLSTSALGGPSYAAADRIDVRGASAPHRASVCGETQLAAFAPQGRRLALVMRLRGQRRSQPRQRPRRARLLVSRCASGSWRRVAVRGLGRVPARGVRRVRREFAPRQAGAYRATLSYRRGTRRVLAHRYLVIEPKIVDVPVSFKVRNQNQLPLPCAVDDGEYTLAGRLTGPADALAATRPAVTLYLHEFSFGKFFWGFPVQGYDHAHELARQGLVSLAIDRLGYDASPGPEGTSICLGSHADMARQTIEQLRNGSYATVGAPSVSFAKVALAGHSVGGATAELVAHSLGGVDALLVLAWADQGYSQRTVEQSFAQGGKCSMGGEPAEEGRPSGYAYYGETEQEFKDNVFYAADPSVVALATQMRNRDPCGDASSLTPASTLNSSRLADVHVPVLLVYGEKDSVFEQPQAGERQAEMFSGSSDVELQFIPETGHALTLERTAPRFRAIVSRWLAARGF